MAFVMSMCRLLLLLVVELVRVVVVCIHSFTHGSVRLRARFAGRALSGAGASPLCLAVFGYPRASRFDARSIMIHTLYLHKRVLMVLASSPRVVHTRAVSVTLLNWPRSWVRSINSTALVA